MPTNHGISSAGSFGVSAPSEQLDLFENQVFTDPIAGSGVPGSIARAMVPPAWWPLVSFLWDFGSECVVETCCDRDGILELAAHSTADEDLEPLLTELRTTLGRTCGACGQRPAERVRYSFTEPARVVCVRCRDRIAKGESFLAIADSYWTLGGDRRSVSVRVVRAGVATDRPVSRHGKVCSELPPAELRALIRRFRDSLLEQVVGQDEACNALGLNAALHCGGGLSRGPRLLVLGPTGVGKSTLFQVLRDAMEREGYSVPWVLADALDLSSPPWSGAPSIGDLLLRAIGDDAPDSDRARRAVVVIDELHHAGIRPDSDVTGSSRQKLQETMASWLSLFNVGGGPIQLADTGKVWSSREAMVIGMGAFTGLLDVTKDPSPADLVRAGLPLELATRFEQTIRLSPLSESALRTLLRRWPSLTGLITTCHRLGFAVRIHDEVYTCAARAVITSEDGATPRTGGSWLVGALRAALTQALFDDAVREIVLTPDSLSIPRSERRPPG